MRNKGQALVLLALTLLVLVVATMATLSLAHLTQQKMELQTAADTAAYSQAVVTARTYNSIALLNRAQVATMVAMQGIHSAISFAGTYRGAINATMYAYEDDFNSEFGKCTERNVDINLGGPDTNPNARNTCEIVDFSYKEESCKRAHPFDLSFFGFHIRFDFVCTGDAPDSCDAREEVMGNLGFLALDCNQNLAARGGRVPFLKVEWCRVKGIWNVLDDATGEQGKRAQDEAIAIGGVERAALMGTLPGAIQPLASTSIQVVQGATVTTAIGTAEIARSFAGGGSYNGMDAALGSRAHPFISQRADGAQAIERQLRRVIAQAGAPADEVQVEPNFKGSSFFDEPNAADARSSANHGRRDPHAYASWADEHGAVSVSYRGAQAGQRTPGVADTRHRRTFRGSQASTDEQHRGDTHAWCPVDLNAEARDPALRHTLRPHSAPPPLEPDPCQGSSCIWPGFYDVSAAVITNRGDVYGQPKLLTVATKDLPAQRDPWNLFFRFRFDPSGAGSQVDLSSRHAVSLGAAPDFQSISSGMAYYHRPGHWKEHPNFFNPYWRATLVRSNIDDPGLADVQSQVSATNASAVQRLLGASYQGVP